MQENKCYGKMILRVFKEYKKNMFLGFILGVSLVLSAVLVSHVVGDKTPLLRTSEHKEGATSRLGEEAQVQTSGQNDSTLDIPADPFRESIPVFKKERFTVLLVGVDRRPGETTLSNTDTLLVASINTVNGKVALLSIPRDTQVTIPGYGKDKINVAARVSKGLNTTTALIQSLTGQPIDGYVLADFAGFKKIIDTLGGITVSVEKDMYYVTGDATDGVINLKKGAQHLNGQQALQYARFRQDALADISRTVRQQTVLRAMEKEFLQVKTVPKLPWLIPQMSKSVETNLTLAQLWSLTNVLLHFERPEISSQTLPGNFLTENGISYWKVDPQKSQAVVKRLFEEGKNTSVFFNVDAGSMMAK